jgi:hypothetical protein
MSEQEKNPDETAHNGIVCRIGWEERDGKEVFSATVDFPNGPPAYLKSEIVWGSIPVEIVPLADIAQLQEDRKDLLRCIEVERRNPLRASKISEEATACVRAETAQVIASLRQQLAAAESRVKKSESAIDRALQLSDPDYPNNPIRPQDRGEEAARQVLRAAIAQQER